MKTTELTTRTWVDYKGTISRVTHIARFTDERAGHAVITLDRYNMVGTKVATSAGLVHNDEEWKVIPKPLGF